MPGKSGAAGLEGSFTHNIPWNDGKERTLVLNGTRDAQGKMQFEMIQKCFSYRPVFTTSEVTGAEVRIHFKMVLYADEKNVSPHTLTYFLKDNGGAWSGRLVKSWEQPPLEVKLQKQTPAAPAPVAAARPAELLAFRKSYDADLATAAKSLKERYVGQLQGLTRTLKQRADAAGGRAVEAELAARMR